MSHRIDTIVGAGKYFLFIWAAIFLLLCALLAGMTIAAAFFFDLAGWLIGIFFVIAVIAGALGSAALVLAVRHRPRRGEDGSTVGKTADQDQMPTLVYHADTSIADYLANSLRDGHDYRNKARLASSQDELFEACQSFIEWGDAVNARVRAHAPLYYSDLPQTAPFAMQGKAQALQHMDERLRAHTEIAKKLKEEAGTRPNGARENPSTTPQGLLRDEALDERLLGHYVAGKRLRRRFRGRASGLGVLIAISGHYPIVKWVLDLHDLIETNLIREFGRFETEDDERVLQGMPFLPVGASSPERKEEAIRVMDHNLHELRRLLIERGIYEE